MGKGNNATVVKQVIKNRWYWASASLDDNNILINFVWTQNKIKWILNELIDKSNIENNSKK